MLQDLVGATIQVTNLVDWFPSFIKITTVLHITIGTTYLISIRLRMLKKDSSTQTAVFFQLPYFDNLVIEKYLNDQNKINLIKWLV